MRKKEINGCTVLEAEPGMMIAKGRFVCGTVAWLATNDTADGYEEITRERAAELEAEAIRRPGGDDAASERDNQR